MPLRAIVFDFDGLIADTEWPEYRAVAEQFERHDLEYPPAGWAHVLGSVWAVDWLADLEARLRRPVDRPVSRRDRRRRALALRADLAPLPGVVELLEAAADAGLGLAVASSSPRSWVEPHLERLGLAGWFDAVRTRDDVELAKPAPDLFLAACTALGGAAGRQPSPSRTPPTAPPPPRTAGLACVAVPNRLTRHLDLSHADLVVGLPARARPRAAPSPRRGSSAGPTRAADSAVNARRTGPSRRGSTSRRRPPDRPGRLRRASIAAVMFPQRRLRRLRRSPALRRLVAETRLGVDDLIAPLFVREGIDRPQPIPSLPGVVQHTLESVRKEVAELAALGVPGVILFGVPARKDPEGSGAWDPDGVVQVALRDLRDDHGDRLVLMSDLCLDEYTDHGHCGVLTETGRGRQRRHSRPLPEGCRGPGRRRRRRGGALGDDGRPGRPPSARRSTSEGHESVAVLAYAAKYASALYGPFRDAVDVTIAGGGDRKGYQQDYRNGREALEEIRADVAEGADLVMVKPALAYLDILVRARAEVDIPLAAYHVSGEYAMLKAAAERGWIDGPAVALEHLTAIKRAGADVILTYLAREMAEQLG